MDKFYGIKSITNYDNFFDSGIKTNKHFNKTYALIKNLGYNCQYLEHITNMLNERKSLHVSIITELVKTYVITGVSIIESILYYILKSNNLHKQNDYKLISKVTANDKEVEGSMLRIETHILKKMDEPQEEEMTLDSMLKKIESKKLLGPNIEIYKELNHLRKLRNKIHLYAIESTLDHDYNNFSDKEFDLIRKSLQVILFSTFFSLDKEYKEKLFDFLFKIK